MPRADDAIACSWVLGAATIRDDQNRTVALATDTPADELDPHAFEPAKSATIVAPCGVHTGDETPPSSDALHAWSQDAWDRFTQRVTERRARLTNRGIQLVIRPGAGGRLSDAICTRAWIGRLGDDAPPILADPIGWFTPRMLPDAPDHLERFVDALGAIPNLWGVLERSCAPDASGALVPSTIDAGVLDAAMVRDALARIHAPRRITPRPGA